MTLACCLSWSRASRRAPISLWATKKPTSSARIAAELILKLFRHFGRAFMDQFCHHAVRLPVAICLGAALVWVGPATGSEKLRVAMVNWPPAKIIENGRFGGTDVLMLNE